jgi:hypothetical protein
VDCKPGKKEKKFLNKELLEQRMRDILSSLAENKFNKSLSLTHACLCSDYVDGYAMGMFLFWYTI